MIYYIYNIYNMQTINLIIVLFMLINLNKTVMQLELNLLQCLTGKMSSILTVISHMTNTKNQFQRYCQSRQNPQSRLAREV